MKVFQLAALLAVASAGTADAGDSCTTSADCRETTACCGT